MKNYPYDLLLSLCLVLGACSSSPEDKGTPKEPEPGDPVIESVSGEATNGGSFTLDGTDFGTHTMDIFSGLGPKGWIEKSDPGTLTENTDSGWETGEPAHIKPVISNREAYSGKNSILCQVDSDVGWASTFRFHRPETFDKVFVSFAIKLDLVDVPVQTGNKFFRIWGTGGDFSAPGGAHGSVTGAWYFGGQWHADGTPFNYSYQGLCALGCGTENDQVLCTKDIFDEEVQAPICNPNDGRWFGTCANESQASNLPTAGQWNRMEVYADSSEMGLSNGEIRVSVWKPGQSIEDTLWWTGVSTHRSDWCNDFPDPWEMFAFQNMYEYRVKNPDGTFRYEPIEVDTWYDDLYIQFGTRARIVMGNRPVYEECTEIETQTPTSWSPTAIEFQVNYGGSFESGETAYLFVINSAGRISPAKGIQLR